MVNQNNGGSFLTDIVIDEKNNYIVCGDINGPGNFMISPVMKMEIQHSGFFAFLLKYNENGEISWARTIKSSDSSFYNAVSVDSEENIYTAGFIKGDQTHLLSDSVKINSPKVSHPGTNAIISKYSQEGTPQWVRTIICGSGSSCFNDIATDNEGNIYVAGDISGDAEFDFGDGVRVKGGNSAYLAYNAVLIKYSTDGKAIWGRTVPNNRLETMYKCIAVDSFGSIFVAGYIDGGADISFGNGIIVPKTSSGSKPVLVKYDRNGFVQWVKAIGNERWDGEFYTITVSNKNDIYLTGRLGGDFICKYNVDGEMIWQKKQPGHFESISTDNIGNIYCSGDIWGVKEYDFGNNVFVKSASNEWNTAILVKYDNDGEAIWARYTLQSSNSSYFNSSYIDIEQNPIVVGGIYGKGDFVFGNGEKINSTFDKQSNGIIIKYKN